MTTKMFYVAVVATALAVIVNAAFDEPSRNQFHLSFERGYMGRPAGLIEHDFIDLFVESPAEPEKPVKPDSVYAWDRLSSKDGGATWSRAPRKFVESDEGSGSQHLTSFRAGNVARNVLNPNVADFSIITERIQPGKNQDIRNRYYNADSVMAARGKTSEQLSIQGDYHEPNMITLKVGEVDTLCASWLMKNSKTETWELHVANIIASPEKMSVGKATVFDTRIKADTCRSAQLLAVQSKHVVVMSCGNKADKGILNNYYWIGNVKIQNGDLAPTFLPDHDAPLIFDAGHDAQDFKFGTLNSRSAFGVGWTGHDDVTYPTKDYQNGLTLLRQLALTSDQKRVTQAPMSFHAGLIGKQYTKSGTYKDSATSCGISYSLTKLDQKTKNGAYVLEFALNPSMNYFGRSGYGIVLSNGKKNAELEQMSFHYNKDKSLRFEDHEAELDRSQTAVTPEDATIAKTKNGDTYITKYKTTVILDRSTIEIYANDGVLVFTENYFLKNPEAPLTEVCFKVYSDTGLTIDVDFTAGKYEGIAGKAANTGSTTQKPSSAKAVSLSMLLILGVALTI